MSCLRSLKIVVLALGYAVGAGSAVAAEPFSQWQNVTLAGNKIGHRQVVRNVDQEIVRTLETLVLTLQQPGEAPRSSETVLGYTESLRGEPQAMTKSVRSFSANHQMTARVEGGQWLVTRKTAQGSDETILSIPPQFLLREGVRLALLAQTGDVRELTYFSWNFSAMRFEQYRLRARRMPAEQPYPWQLLREQLQPEGAKPTELFADEQFFLQEERALSGGDEIRIETCGKSCALADFYPVTHVYRQLIRSPVRISEAGLRGKVRYTLVGDVDLQPPETGEQHVSRIGDGWQIEVCAGCGQEPAAIDANLSKALTANYWMAAANEKIQAQVKALLNDKSLAAVNGAEAMATLTRFVSLHMNKQPDYSGYATALEAYGSRQGDCTEHALLLATMARAAGIPARVVVGIAYSNERFLGRKYVFVPHAWVQSWNGQRWQSNDSGLGDFTAGYIALGFSDGGLSDIARINEQLHRIEILSAVQVKQR